MRVMHYVNFVLFVIDIFDKSSVKYAKLMCNGAPAEYINKNNGYYIILSEIKNGDVLSLICDGYVGAQLVVDINNKSQTILMQSTSSLKSNRYSEGIRICVSVGGRPVCKQSVRFCIKNKSPYLKITHKTPRGSDTLMLSTRNEERFINQMFLTDKGDEIFIDGYDRSLQAYKLASKLKKGIEAGSNIYPAWGVSTEHDGSIFIPYHNMFSGSGDILCDIKYKEHTVSEVIEQNNGVFSINFD